MKKTVASLLFMFLPLLTQAHTYWLELKGSGKVGELMTAQLYFGELENGLREKGQMLNSMKAFTASVLLPDGTSKPLTLSAADNCYQTQFMPQQAGTYQIVVVNDTRPVQDWTKHNLGIVRPREYLRAICQVGGGIITAKPVHYLDVTPEGSLKAGQLTKLNISKDGVVYTNAPVKLTTPDGKQTKQTADASGLLTFTPDTTGQYVVDVDFLDKTPGQYQGKDYQAVRNKTALTLIITEAL